MMRTRVKICGITRLEDALAAVEAGADAIGLVFYAASPRRIEPDLAAGIVRRLPPFVTKVGLFVDADAAEIQAVVRRAQLDLIQFHGQETPEFCGGFDRPYIKAIRMREGVDLEAERRRYRDAAGLLLDAYRPGTPGGTGETFDWARIPPALAGEIVLAGGLDADNVAAAIRVVRPYALDVSGGVESAKGIKDHEKIHRFMRGVQLGSE
ncbi:MAG: phosphoribosylanthranilate isomerase [Pseudomonadota bacterium]